MTTTGMNHFTILTDDVPRTADFYRDLLGLTAGYRPDLGFPGAWRYAGGLAVLHVVGGKPREALKPGVIDHACRRQAGTGFRQVFFHDPNGARVELDFVKMGSGPISVRTSTNPRGLSGNWT